MIDAASGGALIDKTPTTVRHLISSMASNTQQFRFRGAITNKVVNEVSSVDNLRVENQLTKLTSLVSQLAISQHQQIPQVKVCSICTSMEHFTNMCPTLQETESDNVELVGAIGGNQYDRQSYQTQSSPGQGQYVVPKFGLVPNMRASNHNYYQQPRLRYPAPLFQQQQQQIPTQNSSPSMEEWMRFQ
ncbi:hypothetical protein CR513_34947, partial [Mucuna pruriens]